MEELLQSLENIFSVQGSRKSFFSPLDDPSPSVCEKIPQERGPQSVSCDLLGAAQVNANRWAKKWMMHSDKKHKNKR